MLHVQISYVNILLLLICRDWFEIGLSELENVKAELLVERERRVITQKRLAECEAARLHLAKRCALLQVPNKRNHFNFYLKYLNRQLYINWEEMAQLHASLKQQQE